MGETVKAGKYLEIDRCPSHPEFHAVCIQEHDGKGGGHGTRLTPSKCCGSWTNVRRWAIDRVDLEPVAKLLEQDMTHRILRRVIEDLRTERDTARAEIAKLQHELAQESARVDTIEKLHEHGYAFPVVCPKGEGWFIYGDTEGGDIEGEPNLRAAVDRVIATIQAREPTNG